MKCEFGFCLVCDKEIVPACKECGTRKLTKSSPYTEVQLPWSNGSRMNVAVCVDCASGPVWKADKKELTQAIWDKWDQMGHNYDKGIVLV